MLIRYTEGTFRLVKRRDPASSLRHVSLKIHRHQAVLWRLRYKLSLRDLAEMFLTRGVTFTHETVREWEERFAPLLTERLRAKRRGKAGKKWHADETYVKVDGRWCYLYRAIDADGTLVDSMLSETRDMDAAKRFFTHARTVVGHAPEKVTTDGNDAYPRAIRETLGPEVHHRTSRYMNNRIEQDHRGVKQRYYPMRGFGSFASAARFCTAHDELRDHFRYRYHLNEAVSLADQRRLFRKRWGEVCVAAGGVGTIRQRPPQVITRRSPLAFRILTLPA